VSPLRTARFAFAVFLHHPLLRALAEFRTRGTIFAASDKDLFEKSTMYHHALLHVVEFW